MADRPAAHHRGPSVYEVIQDSPEFGEVRTTFRRFVLPAAVVFLSWYFLYVLLAAYAPRLMAVRVVGEVTLGILLGLLQFVSTFAITVCYDWWARVRFDPLTGELRKRIERGDFG